MKIEDDFAPDGALARALPRYEPRLGQIEMATAVEETVAAGGVAALEAGTGIGKTFAYLAPVLRADKAAVVSTGTRALQKQLLGDLAVLTAALGCKADVALLKGRANYLCRHRLREARRAREIAHSDEFQKIERFAAATADGDIADAPGVAADSPLWPLATSTRENCLGQKCRDYDECYVYRARERARRARIVVVNHHLFLSDLRLRQEGVAEILPETDALIFDEAHLLPALAPRHFGGRLSMNALSRFARECEERLSGLFVGAATTTRDESFSALAAAARAAADAAEEGEESAREKVLADDKIRAALESLTAAARRARDALEARASEDEILTNLWNRACADSKFLRAWIDGDNDGGEDSAPVADGEQTVRWLEAKNGVVVLHAAPLSARAVFARHVLPQARATIFTSATLSVDSKFDDFCGELGIDTDARIESWRSPFDFPSRARLHLPRAMPPPNTREFSAAALAAMAPLARANGGRAFALFSSLRAMKAAIDFFRAEAPELETLAQGEEPNENLLARFRQTPNAVLVGSHSFWQGVDAPGEALSLVMIDKIPFIPPSDPMLVARDEWRRRRGENPFIKNQLPPAATLMKQVAGRLLRGADDYGVFVVCDPRLLQKPYGKVILRSLPPMPRIRETQEAIDFLLAMRQERAPDQR